MFEKTCILLTIGRIVSYNRYSGKRAILLFKVWRYDGMQKNIKWKFAYETNYEIH